MKQWVYEIGFVTARHLGDRCGRRSLCLRASALDLTMPRRWCPGVGGGCHVLPVALPRAAISLTTPVSDVVGEMAIMKE
jgi:hypothetical protein